MIIIINIIIIIITIIIIIIIIITIIIIVIIYVILNADTCSRMELSRRSSARHQWRRPAWNVCVSIIYVCI